MANYCDFQMKIIGKKENVQAFVSYLQAEYQYQDGYSNCTADKHFFCVLETEVITERTLFSGEYMMKIRGCCAWSVRRCMFKGEYTYYNRWTEKDRLSLKESFRGTHLEEATRDLDLKVEIHSQEPHCGFREHYILEAGHVVLEDFESFNLYCDGENYSFDLKFAI